MMENHSSCSCKQEKEVLKLDSMPLAMAYVPWQKWQNDAEYAFFSKLHYAKL